MLDNEEILKHPSFGQIQFNRSNGTNDFYGSELTQDHYITMVLQSSEVKRTLSKDWYFANKILARVRMTSGQFSEMITSMNNGGVACCTIEYLEGAPVAKFPTQESRKEFVHRQFEMRMKSFADNIRAQKNEAKELVKKKTLSKDDMHKLQHHLDWLTQEVESNIPFFMQCFQETMDEVIFEAKLEVENAIQHKVSVLGLQALHNENKLLNSENL